MQRVKSSVPTLLFHRTFSFPVRNHSGASQIKTLSSNPTTMIRCSSSLLVAQRFHTTTTTTTNPAAPHADAADAVALLRSRNQELEVEVAMLRRQLSEQRQLIIKAELQDDATHVLATTDRELEQALKKKVRRVTLVKGQRYNLLPVPFHLKDAHIAISGEEGTVVEGSWKLVQCAVDVSGVRLVGTSPSLPVIDASSQSSVSLQDCTLEGGRDGVYLSLSSNANLDRCVIQQNIRGLFEGHHCRASCRGSTFRNNFFHCVWLSKPASHSRVKDFVSPPQSNVFDADEHGSSSDDDEVRKCRGDVAFQYNPVEDSYADVLKNGKPVVLTSEQSTTNLSDPSW